MRYLSEYDLVQDCLQLKPAAQEAFYQKHARVMMAICLRYSRDRMEAEDLLHHGFMKAFTHLNTFRGGSLEGWLKRIFVREAINLYHKNKRSPLDYHDEPLPHMEGSVEADGLTGMSAAEIMKLVNELPVGARMVFNLYAIEGYTHPEIAKTMGISEGTSKSQYARARQLLRERLTNIEKIAA